jgi:hypothetical protein
MAFLGFVLTIAVHPWLIGGFVTLRWLVLLGAVPALMAMQERGVRLGWEWTIVLAWGAASLLWAPNAALGADKLLHLAILFLLFNLGGSRDLAQGMCWGMIVNALVCVIQLFGYWPGPSIIHSVPGGLYLNRNMMAEIAGPLAVWAVAQRQWKWSIGPVACMILAPDRAAIVAVGVLIAAWRKRWAWLSLIALGIGFAALTYFKGIESFGERAIIWRHAWEEISLWGNGLGAFRVNWPHLEYVHCDPMEFVYELGIGALPLVWLVWRGFRGDGALATKLAFAALLVESLFSFPFQLPSSAALGASLLGDLYRAREPLRVAEPQRRAATARSPNRRTAQLGYARRRAF